MTTTAHVVLKKRQRDVLARINPSQPGEALEDAFRRLTLPEGADLIVRHRASEHFANRASIGTRPCTADIGDGIETFEALAGVQRATRARVSGIRSRSEWYRQMRSRHGAKVRDAAGKVVANVSYNGRMWRASRAREELVAK